MSEHTKETGENMSAIQLLTLRAQALERSVNWWNDTYMKLAALTVLLAALVFIAQFIASRKGKQLAITQTELMAEKDAQLQLDLKTKDGEIAKAGQLAGEADERAGKADRQAGKAIEHAAQLELKAEQLHNENLELEANLSPRLFKDQDAAGKALAAFAPVNVVIEYLPEIECRRTAGQIAEVLHDFAKWNLLAVRANSNEIAFFDGVTIEIAAAGNVSEDVRRAEKGADALVSALNKTNIKANRHAPDLNIALGVVVVRVGMKPNPALERIVKEWEEKNRKPK